MNSDVFEKIKRKLWTKVVTKTKKYSWYPIIYKAYWISAFFSSKGNSPVVRQYFSATPNPDAGIGHQMANWIAGFWFSKRLDLNFANISFSNPKWEYFLGFGENEISVNELVNHQNYKIVNIPLFDEKNSYQIQKIEKLIKAYRGKKIIFVAEQDQFYFNQVDVREELQNKFYTANSRENEKLIYDSNFCNIAIHVRRGDITVGQLNKNPNLLMRWQDNDYFINALDNALRNVNSVKPIKIYLFSQGKKDDFKEFEKYKNLIYCLDMGAQDSFLHMVFADVLITSKSSFSYKPALLNKNLIISAENFWHGYPKHENWWLTDEKGFLIKKQ